ncbi:hypothetical protein STRAU_4890 [Streptomyces aurantiacus JA 4570]|uniref:Uncharacterized protein n=1 Tax=Streptomyces aurantiacus JA 4570 TaxID=1286094 RepID=S3ZFS1_9ACTN|nr:hypothetical protein STRAU_4890 [Streptomyces aurantiacus JA 4570]
MGFPSRIRSASMLTARRSPCQAAEARSLLHPKTLGQSPNSPRTQRISGPSLVVPGPFALISHRHRSASKADPRCPPCVRAPHEGLTQ